MKSLIEKNEKKNDKTRGVGLERVHLPYTYILFLHVAFAIPKCLVATHLHPLFSAFNPLYQALAPQQPLPFRTQVDRILSYIG